MYVSQSTVKKPEKPKFEVFEPKARRNETSQIAFHCVNEGFQMSAYVCDSNNIDGFEQHLKNYTSRFVDV